MALDPERDPAYLRADLGLGSGPLPEVGVGPSLALEAGLAATREGGGAGAAGLRLGWLTWPGDAHHPRARLSAGQLRVDGRVLLLRGPVHLSLGSGGGLTWASANLPGRQGFLRGTSMYELGASAEVGGRAELFAYARLVLLHGGGEAIDLAWGELGLGASLGI